MATNFKNTQYYVQTTKETVPASTVATGTITTTAGNPTEVVGVGTLLFTQAKAGDWIYIAAQNEIRKITNIRDALSATIDNAFTTPLAGSAFRLISTHNIKGINLFNLATGATAIVDGANMAVGTTVSWIKQAHQSSQYDLIDPVILDATGTTVQVTIQR